MIYSPGVFSSIMVWFDGRIFTLQSLVAAVSLEIRARSHLKRSASNSGPPLQTLCCVPKQSIGRNSRPVVEL